MRPVSVSTVLYDGYDMACALEHIAAAGIRHVEPAYIRGYMDFTEDDLSEAAGKRLRALFESFGLDCLSISAHLPLDLETSGEMIDRRIRFAAVLGAEILIVNSGAAEHRDRILNVLAGALPLCETTGITVALENPGHGGGDLLGSLSVARSVIEAAGSDKVRINYDAGNVWTYSKLKQQPEADAAGNMDLVSSLHLKDIRTNDADWQFCPLGSGNVDLKGLWTLVPDDLPTTVELPLRLKRPGGGDPQRRDQKLELGDLDQALMSSLAFVNALDGNKPDEAR